MFSWEIYEFFSSSYRRCFMKKVVLKRFCNIQHLICANNLNWLLNLNLIYKTLWTGARSSLLISMLGKVNWFHLTSLITLVLLMWKWMSLFLRKNHLVWCWSWPPLLNWIETLAWSLLLHVFFYKHNVYKHSQPQFCQKNKHILSILRACGVSAKHI